MKLNGLPTNNTNYIAAYRSTTLNSCSKHSKWVPTYDKINEADAFGSAFFVTFYSRMN